MRVMVDATAVPENRGGVGRYVDELLPALSAGGVDLIVTCQHRDRAHYEALVPGARVHSAPRAIERRPLRLLWEQTALPALASRLHVDVLHCPHYTMPVVRRVPTVVTLHDATFFSDPELHLGAKVRFFRAATRAAVRRAQVLVVPSTATRDEVLRYAGGDPGRFHVALHGVDLDRFAPATRQDQQRVRTALGLGDMPYVAFLGTLEPRKNVPALVRGWSTAVVGMESPPALVLAGARGWDADVEAAVAQVPPGLRLLRPGYLPLGDLAGFLSGAEVVTYPSLGEGFGLPVLEAMACGATVLTTRRLSLPEVGGEAVAYCDVSDASIAVALRDLLEDGDRRHRLAQRALARARTMTWGASAQAHMAAYRAASVRR